MSAIPLGKNKILGVLRRRVRDGALACPVVSAIEPDAATAVYNQTDDTESVTLLAQTVMSIAVPAVTVDHTAQVTASFDVWRSSNGAGSRVVFLQQDGSATAYNVRRVESLADPGERVTLLAEFTQASGTAFTYELNYLGVNVGDTAEFRNISMRVEIIKR